MIRGSPARSRLAVTPARPGPAERPPPTVWQAEQFFGKIAPPCSAKGERWTPKTGAAKAHAQQRTRIAHRGFLKGLAILPKRGSCRMVKRVEPATIRPPFQRGVGGKGPEQPAPCAR